MLHRKFIRRQIKNETKGTEVEVDTANTRNETNDTEVEVDTANTRDDTNDTEVDDDTANTRNDGIFCHQLYKIVAWFFSSSLLKRLMALLKVLGMILNLAVIVITISLAVIRTPNIGSTNSTQTSNETSNENLTTIEGKARLFDIEIHYSDIIYLCHFILNETIILYCYTRLCYEFHTRNKGDNSCRRRI